MFLGSWKIDDLLTFTVNTHDPSTGGVIDADSVPTYRVYEDETATPLLTGSMALLDSTNTDGFYSEQITLSAANGFEKGKCYSIRIAATVNGITGALIRNFQMEAEVDANTVSASNLSANIAQITGNSSAATALFEALIGETSSGIKADVRKWNNSNVATPDTAGYPKITIKNGTGNGEVLITSGILEANANLTNILGNQNSVNVLDAWLDSCRYGIAQAGSASTITLANTETTVDDYLKGTMILLYGGTGSQQAPRLITAYNGTSKVAMVEPDFITAPTNGSYYVIFPQSYIPGIQGTKNQLDDLQDLSAAAAADAVWDEALAGHSTPGTTGVQLGNAAQVSDIEAITDAIGTPVALDGGTPTLAGMLTKMADDNGGADFDATTDSLEKIAVGGGASAAEIADAVWDEALVGHSGAGSAGLQLGNTASVSDLESYGDLIDGKIGVPVALDGGGATLAGMLTKMADDNGGGDFNAATDSLTEIAAAAVSAADVRAQVLDVRRSEPIPELAGDPGTTPTAEQIEMLQYMELRNNTEMEKTGASTGTRKIRNNAGSTILEGTINTTTTITSKGKLQNP